VSRIWSVNRPYAIFITDKNNKGKLQPQRYDLFCCNWDKVFIDDGKIGLEVLEKTKQAIVCRVTHAKVNGTLIKEEKGINFPDSELRIATLTKTDRQNVLSVIDFVDSFSLSFCQKKEDVRELRELLLEHRRDDAGIVVKIETKNAVSNMSFI